MHAVAVAWLGLGSNLESPAEQIERALAALHAHAGLRVLARSPLYRTTPVGGPPGQPDYCNACAALAVSCSPMQLLCATQDIEHSHGRVRDVRWGPRTLDVDMLAYSDGGGMRVSTDPVLSLPHPRAHERAFVLVPLCDIAPTLELQHNTRVIDLLAGIDRAGVRRWDAP